MATMRISTAACQITPLPGVELGGFLFRQQPSLGVHDPLWVRAIYLEQGDQRLLWLHTDVLGLEAAFVAEFNAWAGSRWGLTPHQVMVSATHTHAGPATVPLINCGQQDPAYMQQLRRWMEQAATQAVESSGKDEVQPVMAQGWCDLAVDRRRTASAHTDPRIGIVAWQRGDGSYAAVLANYAMHHVALGHENRYISGDVAGEAARALCQRLPGQPVVLFTAGACGNLNPPRTGVGFDQTRAWGELLASRVVDALADASPIEPAGLTLARQTVQVPLKSLDEAGVERTAQRVSQAMAERDDPLAQRYRQAVATWRQRMLGRLAQGALPSCAAVDLHAIRLGQVDLLGVGAEIFSSYTDDLQQATGRRLYVVGYANGVAGYVPTPAACEEGGYEADSAFIFYDGLPPLPQGYEQLRDRGIELIASLDRRRPASATASFR
ncbi:MAG TPA: hypothetical protein VF184_02415 [Phycisphaeraceae bacterium]